MTTAAKPAKPAKTEIPAFPAFDMGAFEMPKMDLSAFQLPPEMRDFAEKGVAQARDAYEKYKSMTEGTTAAVEETFKLSTETAGDINKEMLANAKTNLNAAFDHAEKLMAVKTFAEAIELQSSFARSQFETLTSQAKALQEKTTAAAEKSAKPVKDTMTKAFDEFKAA